MDSNIYTNTLRYAREHGELDSYRENLRKNTACAAAIDAALKADHRDMPGALAAVREQFGLDRPAWLLAGYLREQGWDGRYSQTNVEWAKGFDVPPEQSSRVALKPHPVYLNELVDATRAALATRERAEVVHGYRILESTVFVDDRGFALAENPDAPQPFVTWQFTETDSGRDYYWGHYKTDADSARLDFHTRVQEYRNDYDLAEKATSPIAAVEMSTEQNYNQIDGVRNNMAVPPEEKPSVLERLREAREAAPQTERPTPTKSREDLSR